MLRLPDRAQALKHGRSGSLGGLSALVQRPSHSAGSCSRKTAVVQAGMGLPSPFGDAGASASNSWTVPTSVLGRVAPGEAVRFCLFERAAASSSRVTLMRALLHPAPKASPPATRPAKQARSRDVIVGGLICSLKCQVPAAAAARPPAEGNPPPSLARPRQQRRPTLLPRPPANPNAHPTGLGRRAPDRLHRAAHHQL